MGSAKKAVKKVAGGGHGKSKAPKVQPLAPQVKSESSGSSMSAVNTGRRAQSILDPMQAQEDENKEVLG